MKTLLRLLILCTLSLEVVNLTAQDGTINPTYVGTGQYLGLSQPLRDLPAISPAEFRLMLLEADLERNQELSNRSYPYSESALPKGDDPVWQREMGSYQTGKAPLINFDGQTSPYYPPDANGEAGPNHYMQTINTVYAIYSKSGSLVAGPTNLNLLFGSVPGATCNDGDPIILYDEQADRWMVAEFSICGANDYMLVAVSQTNDPTGSWHRYSFDVADMPDYEKFGIWQDGYYMATNNASGKDIYVFQRSQMLVGGTAQMVGFDNPWRPSTIDGFVCVPPADNDGTFAPAGTPGIFIAFNDDAIGGGSDQLWIFELVVNWTAPASSTFSRTQQINVASFDSNFGTNWDNIKQPGTTRELDAIPQVIMNAPQYRNFGTYQTLVCCHTVDVDNTDHAGLRWYELRKTSSSWSIRQQGTYAPDAHSRWMGSIRLNGNNEIALGYSVSSSSVYPGIRYCGQSAAGYTAATGVLDVTEQIIWTGTNSQTAINRWGDYSSISIDPTDDLTFWYTNQYVGSNGARKTRVAAFQFTSPPPVPDLVTQNMLASPSTVIIGQTTNVSCNVKNQGTGPADASVLKYYLSSNTTYDAGDLLLGSDNVTSLNAGGTLSVDELVIIPVNTVTGVWYILFVADADGQVSEGDETNNTGYYQITVNPVPTYPDLVVQDQVADPLTVEAGQFTLASCTVANIDVGAAPATVLNYYLSADVTYNSGDILLASDNVGTLAGGGATGVSESLTIPVSTTAGNWYILFFADATGLAGESDESNNISGIQITVTAPVVLPDLVTESLSANPVTVMAGQTTTVSCIVRNQDLGSAGASLLRYYLSSNITYEAGDILLGSDNIPVLAAGVTSAASEVLTIPSATAAGTWYILFVADADGQVFESNESNNTGYFMITVQAAIVGCNSTTQYPTTTITPKTTWKYQTGITAGKFTAFKVSAGKTYIWSLCSTDGASATYNSELTLRNKANDAFIAYSNDDCGDDARITWTATFTGTVKVVTTQYNCASNTINTKLGYRIASSKESDDIAEGEAFSIYPNPAKTLVHVESQTGFEGISEIRIMDVDGRILKIIPVNDETASVIEIGLDNIPSGFYYLRFIGEKALQQYKLVVTR